MSAPQQDSEDEVRSPASAATGGGGQSAFIYPIRSAVSVKPVGSRSTQAQAQPQSQAPASASASASVPTSSIAQTLRPPMRDTRKHSQTMLTRNIFDLSNPPAERVRSEAGSVQEIDDSQDGASSSDSQHVAAMDSISNTGDDGDETLPPQDTFVGDDRPRHARSDSNPVDMMRKLRLGEDYMASSSSSARMNAGSDSPNKKGLTLTAMPTQKEQDTLENMTLPRFKHIATEHGHMVVTGREGEITRCEDEPIHIPGAVQSFGCMVVLREDEDSNLVIRQVSENTGDILGMTPTYLFRLESFLDCLDEDQADLLWDNLESLDDNAKDLSESGPHVFQLSGRAISPTGMPGRTWKCWCAAHRVASAKAAGAAGVPAEGEQEGTKQPPLIVLEFELVNDLTNPIFIVTPPGSPTVEEADRPSAEGSTISYKSSKSFSPPPSVTTVDSDGTTKVSAALAAAGNAKVKGGLDGMPYIPTPEQFIESTQSSSKPLKTLQRLKDDGTKKRARPRRAGTPASVSSDAQTLPQPSMPRGAESESLDLMGILSQVNEQFSAQAELPGFLKVVVSIVRELTNFSRVMVYQFDEKWNGQVVCELVDWNDTHDLYRGLHFPATDIPKQARDLYMINKIRLLYDRDQPSARMVCREQADLNSPVDMTHSLLRAMSPIHIKYLANMGVRASMSISIVAFNQLWGLISLHTYGSHGRRISFPMRQLCRLIGESVSRNLERLSYTRRLSARKLINTLPSEGNPSGYIISNAEDLLTLFDADFGVIAIGNEAKILGPLKASQEVLAVTEYLRIKKFKNVITSQDVASDFPDMVLPGGLEVIAGLLLVPLSSSGIDFIAFLRKAQIRHVNWAGKPFKDGAEAKTVLEPRKSFKIWSETIKGKCRAWKDEELETASVLCLVYGKFISVWRQREQAMQYNQLNKLLLSNATHEVRTPLNHIINYLEMALDSPLDADTRENLSKSHMASKSLLFVINDLLDLTRHEEGNKLLLQEPFDLSATVCEAVEMHEWETKRRKIEFSVEVSPEKCFVVGDAARVRQIIVNTVSNSVKYTDHGHVHVEMRKRTEEEITTELPEGCNMEIELSVSDTGRGIAREKLEVIFREFEQVESVFTDEVGNEIDVDVDMPDQDVPGQRISRKPQGGDDGSLGLGLAIVARVVKNLGGQLRVDSTVGEGSRFTYLLPFRSSSASEAAGRSNQGHEKHKLGRSGSFESGSGTSSVKSEINSLVEAISAPHLDDSGRSGQPVRRSLDLHGAQQHGPRGPQVTTMDRRPSSTDGAINVTGSVVPLRSVKVDAHDLDSAERGGSDKARGQQQLGGRGAARAKGAAEPLPSMAEKFSSGTAGSRENPPPFVQMPDEHQPTAAAQLTSSSGGSSASAGSPAATRTGSSAADRRRAKAKLINPGKTLSSDAATRSKDKVSPLRVLVVEDDPVNGMILKKRLSMDGHKVSLAVNGEVGVHMFKEDGHSIDVILMDLQMPICNGQDACLRIRDCERQQYKDNQQANRPASHILNGRIPIFAVSATLDFSMRQEMEEIGMDGWVLKPIDFNRLRTLLKGLTHLEFRAGEQWKPGHKWERGGWLGAPAKRPMAGDGDGNGNGTGSGTPKS